MKILNTTKPIVFLMGPTASGKTALATDLYQQENSSIEYEIISVDSAMVFTELDIGSAKPTAEELQLAPHHLIDFIDPAESYSVSQFRSDAIELINQIHHRGKIPLLVGGTMLYFKGIKDGLAEMPSTDKSVRLQVKSELERKGSAWLHQRLFEVDEKTAKRLHANDSQRITRAYEVFLMTSKPLSQWHAEQDKQALANPILSIALAPAERAILHQRIEQRFTQMMNNGFVDEVKKLYNRGDLDLDCPSMRSVGYRQIWQYLAGELTIEEAVERAVIATRQLAKRQYTWLRSWPNIQWFDPLVEQSLNDCKRSIDQFVSLE
ncbi:MAG: tRNA (adenosine(37)-N6)-dimethylallyltransferase MiaA [Kangiellaceae bacterium]|nr:tRNA (adenosine(37)-N6)-dimethylallyltransferase MiaA [Kangiellaceae bacterium]